MAQQQHDRFDLIDEISYPEPSTGKAWTVGVLVALLFIAYGAICIYAEHGWHFGPGRDRYARTGEVFGREARALGWVFIAIGLFMHFNWYWTYHKWLRYLAPLTRIAAIIAFIVSLGWYFMLRCRIG